MTAASAASVNPRSITDRERPFLIALTVNRQAQLVERVRELGYSDATALGLVGWLALKAAGGRDVTSQTTRAKYRAILDEVIASPGMVDESMVG